MAIKAGIEILKVYAHDITYHEKPDASPVTEADQRAERIILDELARAYEGIPVVAEEQVSSGSFPDHAHTLFLVDPLDGTREFIARRGEFTVNIALVENGVPVASAVYAPAWAEDHGWICFADPDGGAREAFVEHPASSAAVLPPPSQWQRLCVRPLDPHDMTAVASRSHLSRETADFLERHRIKNTASAGSALKFCMVARGDADVYPRLSPTMEWDTAAGDAVLRAAGGCVVGLNGRPLVYGTRHGTYTNPSFIAWGCPTPPQFTA